MSDGAARAVELTSIVVIGCCLLFFGWALVQNLAHYPRPAAVLLVALGFFEVVSLRRNLASEGAAFRLRATRDAAFLVAIVLALSEALSPRRWLIGACISSAEFGILLELLARWAAP